MPTPAVYSRRYTAAHEREQYHAILERFHVWCAANDRSFVREMAAFCQQTMGETPSPLQPLRFSPTNERPELAGVRAAAAVPRIRLRGPKPFARPVYTNKDERFDSITEAARVINCPTNTLRRHIDEPCTFLGRRWSYSPFPKPSEERAA